MPETDGASNEAQQFTIQRIYIKDTSFEVPDAPKIFTLEWKPNVNLDINTSATRLNDQGAYEVVLRLTATVKVGEETAFLAEVNQAGIFVIVGFEGKQLGSMLHSYCPNLLFPYGREMVADLVGKGSFPPLHLAPINFDALYAEHLQRQKDAQEEAAEQPSLH